VVSFCSVFLQVTFAVKHALENKASFFLRNFKILQETASVAKMPRGGGGASCEG
jgi:hypothetical protein